MPISHALFLQPEAPGSSAHGFPNGLDMVIIWLDLTDLISPQTILQNHCETNDSCVNSMPVLAHGTALRVFGSDTAMRKGAG